MVSQITLGSVGTQNGRTVINGSQGGLDTDALITALTTAKRAPAVKLEDTDKNLDTQKTTLTSLQSLLTRFKTAVDTLRNPPGVANASQNIFEYRKATTSSVAGADNYVGVTVQPGTNIQNLTIDSITAVAKETRQQTGTFSAADADAAIVAATGDATSGQFSAGTFTLRVLDGGTNASITLDQSDSLNDVASKFNAVKGRTGIQATVIKVASGTPNSTFQLVFSGTQTGLTGGFDLASSGTVITDPDGALSEVTSHVDFATTQSALNAQFKLNGVTVTRESNTVSDLVNGMTFTLKQPLAAGTPVTISVAPDLDLVTNAINSFVDVYNEFRIFQSKQNQLGDDGLPTADAVLASNPALRQITTQISNAITGVVSGLTSGDPSSITEIGLGLSDFAGDDTNPATRNIITVTADTLQSALESNFDAVRNIFEFKFNTDNTDLAVFSRSNNLGVNAFTLTVDRTNGVYEARDPSTNALIATFSATDLGNNTIQLTAQSGSPLDGLQMIYGSANDATVHVSFTQGIADELYNNLNDALTTNTGLVPAAIQEISDKETRNKDEITKIDDQITKYRDQLVDQYAALESALTKANQLLSLLDAQDNARNNA